MGIPGSWGDGSQECCSMHLRLQYVGLHTRPQSHFLKGSMKKGGNSLGISLSPMYFSWSQCTSIQKHTRSADRKTRSSRMHLLWCCAQELSREIEMWHINICLTKICLYHVFFPDNLVYYFFQPRGEEIIEENTSFYMCRSELLSVSKLICIVCSPRFFFIMQRLWFRWTWLVIR